MNKIVVTRSELLGMFGVTLLSLIHVLTRVLLAVEIIIFVFCSVVGKFEHQIYFDVCQQ